MTRATGMMVAPRALTALMRMCVCVQTLMEFELMVETEPVQAHMVLVTLPTHSTGELRVPQAARGTRLHALLALLKRKASPAHTPVSAPGGHLPYFWHSKDVPTFLATLIVKYTAPALVKAH